MLNSANHTEWNRKQYQRRNHVPFCEQQHFSTPTLPQQRWDVSENQNGKASSVFPTLHCRNRSEIRSSKHVPHQPQQLKWSTLGFCKLMCNRRNRVDIVKERDAICVDIHSSSVPKCRKVKNCCSTDWVGLPGDQTLRSQFPPTKSNGPHRTHLLVCKQLDCWINLFTRNTSLLFVVLLPSVGATFAKINPCLG